MRVLLDESLPRPLAKRLTGHAVRTVTQAGWTGLSNLPVAVIVLVADTNRIESLEPLVPSILTVLETIQPKTLVRVGISL